MSRKSLKVCHAVLIFKKTLQQEKKEKGRTAEKREENGR